MAAPKEIIHIGPLEFRFLLDGDSTADSPTRCRWPKSCAVTG